MGSSMAVDKGLWNDGLPTSAGASEESSAVTEPAALSSVGMIFPFRSHVAVSARPSQKEAGSGIWEGFLEVNGTVGQTLV